MLEQMQTSRILLLLSMIMGVHPVVSFLKKNIFYNSKIEAYAYLNITE